MICKTDEETEILSTKKMEKGSKMHCREKRNRERRMSKRRRAGRGRTGERRKT